MESADWLAEVMARPMYFDRVGNPIDTGRWLDLNDDLGYKVVRATEVGGVWRVSTVWMGIDHAIVGPPLIFETMVFELALSNGYMAPFAGLEGHAYSYYASVMDGLQLRYRTETEAIAGHEAVVASARQRFLPAVAT